MRSINKQEEINKDKSKIKVEFSAKNITPYGGLVLFRKFTQKLGIEKVLDKLLNSSSEEGEYGAGKKIMSLVYGLVCGLERPSDTKVLKHDTVFKTIMGYEDYPGQSTFSRFLKAFLVKGAKEIGEKGAGMLLRVRNEFRGWFKPTLDLSASGGPCQDGVWQSATGESGL